MHRIGAMKTSVVQLKYVSIGRGWRNRILSQLTTMGNLCRHCQIWHCLRLGLGECRAWTRLHLLKEAGDLLL